MADDIVTRLRAAKGVNWSHYSAPPMGPLFDDAADEIERLRIRCNFVDDENDEMHDDLMRLLREIERLRDAGDEMAEALHGWCNGMDAFTDDAERVRAWKEARRG